MAGLTALLQSGSTSVTSAHVQLSVTGPGISVTGSGNETFANDKPTALEFNATLPDLGSVGVVSSGGKLYLKVPASLNSSGKPYLLVSPSSSNPIIKQLMSGIAASLSHMSPDQVRALVESATTVTPLGQITVRGQRDTEYAVTVDVTKLASTFPALDKLKSLGLSVIPVTIDVDNLGRPVLATTSVTEEGESVVMTLSISKYNAPVTITAPPADQVSSN